MLRVALHIFLNFHRLPSRQ